MRVAGPWQGRPMSPRPRGTKVPARRPPSPPRISEPLIERVPADLTWASEEAMTGIDLLPGALADGVALLEWEQGRATGVAMPGLVFDRCHLTDLELSGCDLSAARFDRSTWTRMALSDCRASGLDLSGSTLLDVAVSGGRAAHANLRFAVTERISFSGVDLTDLDAYGADLTGATFDDCDLTGAQFTSATCTAAVFRGCRLTGLRGVEGLKGATVSGTDLWAVADLLAGALGITVEHD
jgi:uncharacterized protein YjbI with pentapeptide repeats